MGSFLGHTSRFRMSQTHSHITGRMWGSREQWLRCREMEKQRDKLSPPLSEVRCRETEQSKMQRKMERQRQTGGDRDRREETETDERRHRRLSNTPTHCGPAHWVSSITLNDYLSKHSRWFGKADLYFWYFHWFLLKVLILKGFEFCYTYKRM